MSDVGFVAVPLKDDLGISVTFSTEAITIEGANGEPEVVLDPFLEGMHVLRIGGPMPLIREIGGMIQKAADDALRGPEPYAAYEGLDELEKRARDGDR